MVVGSNGYSVAMVAECWGMVCKSRNGDGAIEAFDSDIG